MPHRFKAIRKRSIDDLPRLKAGHRSSEGTSGGEGDPYPWESIVIFSDVPWSKVAILGMVIPPLIGILIMGVYIYIY